MPVPLKVSSLVRALGPAIATAIPASGSSAVARAAVLGSTDIVAREVDPNGITIVSVTPDEGDTFTAAQELGSRALTTSTWVGIWLLLGLALERAPLPRVVKALGVGAAVYLLDGLSSQLAGNAAQARSAT